MPRHNTQEIDALKASIGELSTHLKGVSSELAAEREARQNEKDKGVSVTRLHVPFLIWFVTFGGAVGGATAVGMFVHDTKVHTTDTLIHADRDEAIKKDGIAYKKEIADAVASSASDFEASVRRVNRAVKHGAQCKPSKVHGEFLCAFEDPETLKLRPP